MRRQDFLGVLVGATAWPVVVRGQPSFILVLVLSVWIGIGTASVCHAAEQKAERSLSLPLDLVTNSDNCHDNRAISAEAIIDACTARIKSERLSQKDLASAYNLRGLAYQRQANYDRAITDFNLAIKADPKFSTAYSNLANSLRVKGDLELATQSIEAGIRISPTNANLYNIRGLIAASSGKHEAAIADYDHAIKLKSDFAYAFVNRGDAHLNLKRLDQACADYEAAIKIDGKNGVAFSGRSFCFLERRDVEQALTAANVAIVLYPDSPSAYNARGRAYRAKRELDKAVADFDMAIKLRPDYAAAFINRARVWHFQEKYDKAIDDLSVGLRIDPTRTSAYTHRGLAYLAKGDIEAGRKDLQTAIDLPAKYFGGKRLQDTARSQLALLTQPGEPRGTIAPQISNGGQIASPQSQAPAAKSQGKRVALVVGNGKYLNVAQLPNPSNDARAVAATLRELGFDVIEGIDLGRTAMEQHLRDFLQRAASARIALIFYAGHGMQVDGHNYLVPVDAKLAARTDLDFDTVDLDKILAALDDDDRANIIMLDACRDNPLAKQFAELAGKNRSVSANGGLAAYSSVGTGTLIAFATAPGRVANDGEGTNSPFTTALLKHIKTADLEVRQMMTRVRADVAASTGKKQIPWDNSSLLGDIFLGAQN